MGKETALPKNIRQIGDIRGREKICMEDYVMTYIRKKEPEEERGYLGIFLGEKKQMEDSDYIFIRGILEIPAKNVKEEKERRTEEKRSGKREPEGKEAAKKWTAEGKTGENKTEDGATEENGKAEDAESNEETLAERILKERRLYFPDWEIQGCCVIGTYPAARMEELTREIPESGNLLYHLQEQEENFYWMKDGQYQRIRGYFVFYEQNRLMQEYMAEVFGNNSVEKESHSDRAIKNFREKIAQKSEKKSRSMLKLASSFFVVTVLVVGAVVVNRMEDIRQIQSLPELAEEAGAYQAAEVSAYQAAEPVSSTGAAAENNTADVSAVNLEAELAGAASFWEEEFEDAASDTIENAAEHTETVSVDAEAISENAGNASGNLEIISEDAQTASGSAETISGTAESASGSAETTSGSVESASGSAETISGNAESISGSAETTSGSIESASGSAETTSGSVESASGSAETVSENAVSQSSDDTSATDGDPAAQEVSSVRQMYAAYVIKEGDTLADICSRYYGSLERLEEICETNGIEDANRIMPGQKIVLP